MDEYRHVRDLCSRPNCCASYVTDGWCDVHRPVPKVEMVIPLNEWSRASEVWSYAQRQGITAEEAVQRLVNHALSHRAHQAEQRKR